MIPIRLKKRIQAIVSNFLSYTYQAISFLYSEIKCEILYTLLVMGEDLYTYGYSHYFAYKNRIEDIRLHTHYLKDGYGRRYRISRRPNSFYDPINFHPSLPFRHRRRSVSGIPQFYPNKHGPGHAAAGPVGPWARGADVVDGTYVAGARASVAARQYEPRPRSSAGGDGANTANIRVAECSEATGMESIRPERA